MKKIILIIYLTILVFKTYSQCNSANQVSLDATCASSINAGLVTSDQTVVARDQITMKAGFSVSSVNGKKFEAKIDYTKVYVTNDYLTGTGIVTGTSRPLDKTNCAPGSVGGSINVSPTGAATYNVPIIVSPGTRGMQPNLSIVYNSQSGNGVLGYGWHLNGLSVISRTSKNLYYEGTTSPVKFDANDALALDGARLIKTGTNQYSPENNPYTVVTTDASFNFFTVTTQDGVSMEYRQKFLPKGGDIAYAWAITKITDTEGNYMQYIYLGDNTTGEYRISEIKYTGNTGKAPYNSVIFTYDKRTDVNTNYICGKETNKTLLMTSIKVFAEGILAYDYKFSYFYDGYYSKLNQIALTAKGFSYNPTVIDWGASPNFTTTTPTTNSLIISAPYISDNFAQIVGDMNGDGLQDFAQIVPSDDYPRIEVAFLKSDGSYLFSSVNLKKNVVSGAGDNYDNYEAKDMNVADWDNDGKDEIMVHYLFYKTNSKGDTSNYKHLIYKYSCSGTTINNTPVLDCTLPAEYSNDEYRSIYGDFDNNNKTDRIIIRNSTNGGTYSHVIYDVTMNGTLVSSSILYNYGSVYSIRPIEFDGDGQLELLFLGETGFGEIFKFNRATNDFESIYYSSDAFATPKNLFTGDVNGDGITDLVRFTSAGWATCYGKGFVPSSTSGPAYQVASNVPITNNPSASTMMLTDINGDGKSDIVYALYNTFYVYISKGMTFSNCVAAVNHTATGMTMVNLIATPDEKGQTRIIYYNNGNNYYYLTSFANKIDNALYAYNITDGNNNTSAITYGFYKDLAPAALSYPLRVFNAPIRQVSN
ncbi:MAG TPA: SpvB/TcaC N-terminal domain-containing protein, partial [Bacteroidales bacterium]